MTGSSELSVLNVPTEQVETLWTDQFRLDSLVAGALFATGVVGLIVSGFTHGSELSNTLGQLGEAVLATGATGEIGALFRERLYWGE